MAPVLLLLFVALPDRSPQLWPVGDELERMPRAGRHPALSALEIRTPRQAEVELSYFCGLAWTSCTTS